MKGSPILLRGCQTACRIPGCVLIIVLLPALGSAQVTPACDWSQWFGVTDFVGTLTMTGVGTGTDHYGDKVTLMVSVNARPEMGVVGPFTWSGFLNATVNYQLVVVDQNGDTWTIGGQGPAIDSSGSLAKANLVIDPAGCTYSLFSDSSVAAIETGPKGLEDHIPAAWGPVVDPSGRTNTGPPLQFIPLPTAVSGANLRGSFTYDAYDTNTERYRVSIQWKVAWNFAAPKDCILTIPTLYNQGDRRWGSDVYDHGDPGGQSPDTIAKLGCALTSMTMAMINAGWNGWQGNGGIGPAAVNTLMQQAGDFNGLGVNWDAAVRDLSRGSSVYLKFDSLGGRKSTLDDVVGASKLLDDQLCGPDPHPVIVGVYNHGQVTPGHFVLVTGKQGNNYIIADPAGGVQQTLSRYGDFETRGIVKDPPGDISQMDIAVDRNASILVTDSSGNRSGLDPVAGSLLQQIPGSAAFIDRIDNDIDGTVSPITGYYVQIPQPPEGGFQVVVNGISAGPYSLTVRGFNQDGGIQPPIVIQGVAQPGSATTYMVKYASSSGSITTIDGGPAITSASTATFTVGAPGTFKVTATGSPSPSLSESGALPSSIAFNPATGELSGTPGAGTGGVYIITFTASNSVAAAAQSFTLAVNERPTITSANNAAFTVGTAGSFVVTTTGFPVPSLTEAGALPAGLAFVDNGKGSGTLSGTPSVSGSFNISFTASNGVGGGATQDFKLTVSGGGPIATVTPTSINFGNVYLLASIKVTLQNTGASTLTISQVSLTPGTNTDPDDFLFVSFCGSSLAAGMSCPIYVYYFADGLGTDTATVNITDNAPGSPHSISLRGTAINKSR